MDQPDKVANPARGQLNREHMPRSRLRIWSREKGSAVPSRVSPLNLHTQAEEYGAYSRDSSRFPRRRPVSEQQQTDIRTFVQNRHTALELVERTVSVPIKTSRKDGGGLAQVVAFSVFVS